MEPATLTNEDRQWLLQPVNVEMPPDDIKWLDTMLEMKQSELINYAVYSYGLPEAGVQQLSRQEIIQMIVMANKAGGGQSVLQTRYRYLTGLEGKVPVAIEPRPGSERRLYLTRGEGDTMQVYNKATGEWANYYQLAPKNPAAEATRKATEPTPSTSVSVEALLPALSRMQRPALESIADNLGIKNPIDLEIYPTNNSLVEAIKQAGNVSNAHAEGED